MNSIEHVVPLHPPPTVLLASADVGTGNSGSLIEQDQ